ncbi:MAG: metallopeptidase TldD-related protein [bacterium]
MDSYRITSALARAGDVCAWFLNHERREETTVIRLPGIYSVTGGKLRVEPNPHPREVISVRSETARCRVYSEFEAGGAKWRGDAVGQFTADDDEALAEVIAGLVAAARSQQNPPFPLPGAHETHPNTQLADPELEKLDPAELPARARAFIDAVVSETARLDRVEVSNVELFVRRLNCSFRSSAGHEFDYPATRVSAEVCFLARPEGDKVGEHTARLEARSLAALDPAAIVEEYGIAARDIALAGPPPAFTGPVVLLGEPAADFFRLDRSPLGFHANSRSVYEKTSRYHADRPCHAGELKAEPLNLVSNPLVPLGLASARADQVDGGPVRAVTICRHGNWDGLLGTRRYHYLLGLLEMDTKPPGGPGNTVIPAGRTPVADLLCDSGDAVVVRAFSAFEADPSSGRFACEIRLGELRRGDESAPFTGGLLVGNWFEAIADARYSHEMQVQGGYRGPLAVRFGGLQVAG